MYRVVCRLSPERCAYSESNSQDGTHRAFQMVRRRKRGSTLRMKSAGWATQEKLNSELRPVSGVPCPPWYCSAAKTSCCVNSMVWFFVKWVKNAPIIPRPQKGLLDYEPRGPEDKTVAKTLQVERVLRRRESLGAWILSDLIQ